MRDLQIQELLLASHNAGKLREFAALVADFGIKLHSAAELGLIEPEETGMTFEENAALKARAASQATGLVALADDSGLCIEALDGAPGVHTARWTVQRDGRRDFGAAMARVERELQARGATKAAERRCHFVCVIALAWPEGEIRTFRGEVEGHIHHPPRGEGGFGYDPIFMPTGFNKTFAEMTVAEKQGYEREGKPLSHRARALTLLRQALLET